jgi:threonine synthase
LGEAVTDEEIVEGIQLLARTEGIFTEPAGGTTVAVTKKLIEQGRIPRNESIVICITGNGYKTIEAVLNSVEQPFIVMHGCMTSEDLYRSAHSDSIPICETSELH